MAAAGDWRRGRASRSRDFGVRRPVKRGWPWLAAKCANAERVLADPPAVSPYAESGAGALPERSRSRPVHHGAARGYESGQPGRGIARPARSEGDGPRGVDSAHARPPPPPVSLSETRWPAPAGWVVRWFCSQPIRQPSSSVGCVSDSLGSETHRGAAGAQLHFFLSQCLTACGACVG